MSTDLSLPGPDMPIIDESRLVDEFDGDEEILAELRDLFLEHAPPLYNNIRQATSDHDLAAIARDSHSLKGACATYGVPRLAMMCKMFEDAAKAGDWDLINDHQDLFVSEYEKVFTAIASLSIGQ